MRRTMFVEEDKCIGCYACTVACQLEHDLPPRPVQPPLAVPKGPEPIRVLETWPEAIGGDVHASFRPIACVHCLDAPCIPACPLSAIFEDEETGVIRVSENECTCCELCLQACAHGAPQFYDGRMILCDLCAHRLGAWGKIGRRTACEAACPARAIHVGTTEEISILIAKAAAERADRVDRKAEWPYG
jgi:Fe-S-cluster-containing dehydrogenase component